MLGKPIVRFLRRFFSVQRRAGLIAKLLPPSRWYSAAVALTRLQWAVCRLIWWRPDIALRNAVYLDMVLLELMKHGTFPIRWRAIGAEHLVLQDSDKAGILVCGAHLPLFTAITRTLTELNAMPDMVIALEAAIGPDGTYPLPGLDIRVPALPPGPKAMVRSRRVLLNRGLVASLMDEYPGGPLKPQLLRLGGRLGAKVVYIFTELDDDNFITLTAVRPPFPACATEADIDANLAAYDAERQRILAPFHGNDQAAQPRAS